MILKYLSRKFVLAALTLFGGFWLVHTGKPLGELTAYVTVVLGFYTTTNLYENVQRMKIKGVKVDDDSSTE